LQLVTANPECLLSALHKSSDSVRLELTSSTTIGDAFRAVLTMISSVFWGNDRERGMNRL